MAVASARQTPGSAPQRVASSVPEALMAGMLVRYSATLQPQPASLRSTCKRGLSVLRGAKGAHSESRSAPLSHHRGPLHAHSLVVLHPLRPRSAP